MNKFIYKSFKIYPISVLINYIKTIKCNFETLRYANIVHNVKKKKPKKGKRCKDFVFKKKQ